MKMNWKDEAEKTGGFEVYPEGGYILKVDSWEQTEASTGTKQVRVKFVISKGGEHVGKPFTDHFALTEKALWRVANFIAMCGFDTTSLAEMEVGSPSFYKVLSRAKGRKVGASISVDTYNGKTRNRVEQYMLVEKDVVDMDGPDDDDLPDFLKVKNVDSSDISGE